MQMGFQYSKFRLKDQKTNPVPLFQLSGPYTWLCFFGNPAIIGVGIRAWWHHIRPFSASFRSNHSSISIGFQEVELKSERFRVCEALFEPAHCHSLHSVILMLFLEGDGKGEWKTF